MDRPDIRVMIGAGFDRSFDAVLAEAERKYQRAFGTRPTASGAGARQMFAAEQQIYNQRSKLNQQIYASEAKKELELAKLRMKLQSDSSRARQADARAQDAHIRAYYRNMVTEHTRAETAKRAEERKTAAERARSERAERMASYKRDREIDRLATRTSHRATRFFFPPPEGMLGYAKRTAMDVARGAGIDFSLGGGIARARERESAGMGLAQQERIATGSTQGGAFWSGISGQVGSELKVAPEQVTEMMRSFTGKTGDFAAAAASAKELASMTLASGANMGEMGSAAGFVYNQLKGMPDAAERTLDVMRGIVGQTAVGAVEMEEYAKQMGRIAANAKMFQGDVSKNILELSALTQLSIAEGGATSGADAARSIAAFANTTSKGQRINAFAKHGVKLFNESGTQKRPILDIIKDSLIKSKGSIPEMTKMWADTLGQKPIRGLTNAFNEAGGGEKGWQAALEKIKPFMNTQMTKEVERANIADYEKTTAARAQAFQNSLDKITDSMANRLLPTMEKMAPTVLDLTQKFALVVNWAAENPGKAITAAITASIARAGLESVGRMFLDRLIGGIAGEAIGGGVGGGLLKGAAGLGGRGVAALSSAGGGIMGASGVAGVLLATAAAAGMLTTAFLESADQITQESKRRQGLSGNDVFQTFVAEYSGAKTDEERAAAMKRAKTQLEMDEGSRGAMDRLFGNQDVFLGTMRAIDDFAKSFDERQRSTAEAQGILGSLGQGGGKPIAEDHLAVAIAGALVGKTMNVRVSNTDDFNFTPVSGGGGGGAAPKQFDWGP